MSFLKRFTVSPPEDIELHVETRKELAFSINFPDNYSDNMEYPLIVSIPGWGDDADSEYQENKLRPYLSEKYNALVLGVRYHDDKMSGSQFFVNNDMLRSVYGIIDQEIPRGSAEEVIEGLFSILIKKKVYIMDRDSALFNTVYADYPSFGFLPALDHLKVLHYVLNAFNIKKNSIYLLGSSYGGYIGLLMSKFAPQTFSFVAANSPFVKTNLTSIFPAFYRGFGSITKKYEGKEYIIPIIRSSIWSPDETSLNYFSDSHREIRSLLYESHWYDSQTIFVLCHSTEDVLEPIVHVDKFIDLVRHKRIVHYNRISADMIDGVVFKEASHGMGASIKKIFDRSWGIASQKGITKEVATDFDKCSTYAFDCSRKQYIFNFDKAKGVHVDIIPGR